MAEIIRGMRNWISYSTMRDDEWECLRETHLEQEVRRLFCTLKDEDGRTVDRELGSLEVPVRSGAFRQLRRVPGKVFLSRDLNEAGEQYRLHVMVSSRSGDEVESWEPVCSWAFDSAQDMNEFVGAGEAGPAA